MKLEYTIIEGTVHCNNDICEIPFALVFFENGVYRIETFFKDKDYFDRHKEDYYFTLFGKTEKGYEIEIQGLFYTLYKTANQKVEFNCHKHIKISNFKDEEFNKPLKSNPQDDFIHFIEIEGMKTHFGNHTEFKKFRNTGEVDELTNFEFDHTTCAMHINHPDFQGNSYYLIFKRSHINDNIIVDFTHHKGYSRLFFKNYLQIKTELITFLSFLNGGPIVVRRELTGRFYKDGGKDSQIVYLYSRKYRSEFRCDDFIPIDCHHSYTKPIFSDLFLNCFDKYYQLNKVLDFNALVISLNNSFLTTGLEESYYILITALEKICNNYSRINNSEKQTLIDKKRFDEEIKPMLFEVLQRFEKDIKRINKSAYFNLKSKIGGLNKSNDDIKQRMYEFLEYAKIPINGIGSVKYPPLF